MEKLIGKLIYFFRSEKIAKYLVEISLFVLSLLLFLSLVPGDVAGNVLGTVIGFLFSTVLLYIFKVIARSFEDNLKVSYNTERILQLYKGDPGYCKELTYGGTTRVFAYADRLINRGYRFEVIDDNEKMFSPDDFVMENYETIFAAHANSTKFNATTIRLDRFEQEGDLCRFYLSRSTVFNHLVTNRAIDYVLFDNITLRDMYEYGPRISDLENSKMSNHIGINALVFLSDGKLLIPRRKKDSTISKNMVTSSIAVKLDFPESGGDEITVEHLLHGTIIENLDDRLNMPRAALDPARIEVRFLGFGQNLYEGGKPQFYYAVWLKDVDTEEYLRLSGGKAGNKGLDVDKQVYIADYESFSFKKGLLSFNAYDPTKHKHLAVVAGFEMSYLCNLWHFEESKGEQK